MPAILLGFFVCAAAIAQHNPPDAPGILTVFLPAGSSAVLLSDQGILELQNGEPRSLPAGQFRLVIRHSAYRLYEAVVQVPPGSEITLLPRLQMSDAYAQTQAQALERRLGQVQKTRRALRQGSQVNLVLALAGLAAVGGLEWLLAGRKNSLAETYQRYLSASAAEAPALWATIEDLDAQIGALRLGEGIALAASGAFLAAGAITSWSRPSTRELDDQLRLLRDREMP